MVRDIDRTINSDFKCSGSFFRQGSLIGWFGWVSGCELVLIHPLVYVFLIWDFLFFFGQERSRDQRHFKPIQSFDLILFNGSDQVSQVSDWAAVCSGTPIFLDLINQLIFCLDEFIIMQIFKKKTWIISLFSPTRNHCSTGSATSVNLKTRACNFNPWTWVTWHCANHIGMLHIELKLPQLKTRSCCF